MCKAFFIVTLFTEKVATDTNHQTVAEGTRGDMAHIRRLDAVSVSDTQHRVLAHLIVGIEIVGEVEAIAPPAEMRQILALPTYIS